MTLLPSLTAQRAHANFIENLPTVLTTMVISGIKFPVLSGSLGAGWAIARILYVRGYILRGPKGRYESVFSPRFLCLPLCFSDVPKKTASGKRKREVTQSSNSLQRSCQLALCHYLVRPVQLHGLHLYQVSLVIHRGQSLQRSLFRRIE